MPNDTNSSGLMLVISTCLVGFLPRRHIVLGKVFTRPSGALQHRRVDHLSKRFTTEEHNNDTYIDYQEKLRRCERLPSCTIALIRNNSRYSTRELKGTCYHICGRLQRGAFGELVPSLSVDLHSPSSRHSAQTVHTVVAMTFHCRGRKTQVCQAPPPKHVWKTRRRKSYGITKLYLACFGRAVDTNVYFPWDTFVIPDHITANATTLLIPTPPCGSLVIHR